MSQIADEQTPPPNLKPMVCGSGIPVAKADQVTGWGVSLGRYKGVAKADSVLASNFAIATGTLLDTMPRGVVKVPFARNEYLALAWGMPQQQTETVCNQLRGLNHHCEVVSPEAFQQFQRQALQERSKPQPTPAKSVKRKSRKPANASAKAAKSSAAKTTAADGVAEEAESAKGDQ